PVVRGAGVGDALEVEGANEDERGAARGAPAAGVLLDAEREARLQAQRIARDRALVDRPAHGGRELVAEPVALHEGGREGRPLDGPVVRARGGRERGEDAERDEGADGGRHVTPPSRDPAGEEQSSRRGGDSRVAEARRRGGGRGKCQM